MNKRARGRAGQISVSNRPLRLQAMAGLAGIILVVATNRPVLAQDGPGPGDDPATAMTIEPSDPPIIDPDDPPSQSPDQPDSTTTTSEYDDHNPIGVTGIFNGNVATGCSYDPLSHSAQRVIDDIVVPGSVGKYPLKMTRYYNSRSQYYGYQTGLGPGWAHEYSWHLPTSTKVVSPHGAVYDYLCAQPVGVSEGWETHSGLNGTWRLADGGKVVFTNARATSIIDPYGL